MTGQDRLTLLTVNAGSAILINIQERVS
jgi:hypothetical protein